MQKVSMSKDNIFIAWLLTMVSNSYTYLHEQSSTTLETLQIVNVYGVILQTEREKSTNPNTPSPDLWITLQIFGLCKLFHWSNGTPVIYTSLFPPSRQ